MEADFRGERFDNICAGLQRMFEHRIIQWITYWANKSGVKHAVFGGGSFMNVKANMLISELPVFENVFFCPSSGDESTAIGAAYFVAELERQADIQPLTSLYLGPSFDNDYIENVLGAYKGKVEWTRHSDIDRVTAESLAEGNILARFRGASEWGARALGNRSILCRADNPGIIHRLNKAVKMRDFWMPFASSVLAEDSDEYIHNPSGIQGSFMILTYRSKPKARADILAGLHPFDLTCRAQFVFKETNPQYHALLRHFKDITGFSGLLNTSFNQHGYPIVGSPEGAIETLLNTNLDGLVLENYFITPKAGVQPPFEV